MSVAVQQPVNLGPGQLDTGEDPFVLSSADWLAIQTYTAAAAALPITSATLAKAFGLGAGDDPSSYSDILGAYQGINGHCATWTATTFPAAVALADDIVHYDAAVDTYYGALSALLPDLRAVDPSAAVKAKFKAILDERSAEAAGYRDKAQAVAVQVAKFATETIADGKAMTQLADVYKGKLGSTSTDRKQLEDSLASWTATLERAQDEYHHDVVVASTTPTYAWVGFPLWPIGLIAAGVVAGIYGPKAVQAKNDIENAKSQVDQLTHDIARDTTVMAYVNAAQTSMGSIASALTRAQPIIERVEGVWDALASDLSALGRLVVDDIEKALPIIMDLGIDSATKAWHAVAHEANDYRVNAFITVTGSPSD